MAVWFCIYPIKWTENCCIYIFLGNSCHKNYDYALPIKNRDLKLNAVKFCVFCWCTCVYLDKIFLVVFFLFRKNYLLLSCATSVRPSVEIISFRGNSLSNRPIDLKIGLNVREGVVHVRKAWFFEIRIASCKFFAIYVNCERYCRISLAITVRVSIYT